MLSFVLLPLRLAAFVIRTVLSITRRVVGGVILGCLAPLGLLALLLIAVLALLTL